VASLPLETRIKPKLISVLREGYTRQLFAHDLGAGLIVGVLALPLALAFAIASGVKPEQGLFTAIIAGFVISALSGSRVQIGGPTGAFIVIVYSVVQRFGYEGLTMLSVPTSSAKPDCFIQALARAGAIVAARGTNK
jgi:sulfate permease, SulP family